MVSEHAVTCLAGCREPEAIVAKPYGTFDERVCRLLDEWSFSLRRDEEAGRYPDIMSFAFFCRKGNIERLKKRYEDGRLRLGRGLVFHIAPSNVPVNFAYSLVFGLLAGNGNIVRVPSGPFPQTHILCRLLDGCLERWGELKEQNSVVSYPRTSDATRLFSGRCQMRVVWGGDDTIAAIRRHPLGPRAGELTFADRYSLALLDGGTVGRMDEEALAQLARSFYNDTYLMDQNACSSPHLILWKGGTAGRERFWNAVFREAGRYELADIKVSDKYTDLCGTLMKLGAGAEVRRWENLLYVIRIKSLPDQLEALRGRFGCFYEYDLAGQELAELTQKLTGRVQTITYAGLDSRKLGEFLIRAHAEGVDRIVPVGKALDIGLVWDGQDMIYSLSREIWYE